MQLRTFMVFGAALTLAACGSSSARATTAPTEVTPVSTGTTASATIDVPAPDPASGGYGQGKNESQSSFMPPAVTIAVGGTVTWANHDITTHTTTSSTGAWDETLGPGATYSRAFPSAGTFPYKCMIHPNMQGSVTVK